MTNSYGTTWYQNLPFKREPGDVHVARVEIDVHDASQMEAFLSLVELIIGKEKFDWIAERSYTLKTFAYEDRSSLQVVFYFAINLTPEQTTEYHLYWAQDT